MARSFELERLEQACTEHTQFVRDTRPTGRAIEEIVARLDALNVAPWNENYLCDIMDSVRDLAPETGAACWAREYGADLLRCIDALRRSNAALIADREELQRENAILRAEGRRVA